MQSVACAAIQPVISNSLIDWVMIFNSSITNLGLYPLSRFNLSLLVVSANIFHKPFLIFDLDKQHPV
jgi:hypothetical protein